MEPVIKRHIHFLKMYGLSCVGLRAQAGNVLRVNPKAFIRPTKDNSSA